MEINKLSDFKIAPKHKVLCQELNTVKNYNGFFYFDEKSIKSEIYSFDGFFYIKDDAIFLHSENNNIISLHTNITAPAGSCSRNIEPKMTTHRQDIISNVAVLGHDKWQKEDLVKRVSFLVKYSDELFKHRDTFDKYIKNKLAEDCQSDIFSISVNGFNIRVSYCATYNLEFSEPREIWPRIEIEFEDAINLFEYLEHVTYVVRFLSLSLGVPLTPSDFNICQLSFEDMVKAVEANSYPGDYSVKYVWPEPEFCDRDLWLGGALVVARDDEELGYLKDCLISWVARYADWGKASDQMMRCLTLSGEISPDRLLAACKWFEEIPLTKAKNAISDEHIKEIVSSVSEKATELGYSEISKRISGSLKSIKTETHEDRFRRLVQMINDKFYPNLLDENSVRYLKKSQAYRGKVAHGHFSPSDDEDFHMFTNSIYAMEALCLLLTVYDLPMGNSGIGRLQHHPLMRNYRLSIKK